ncbi:MAG: hypothetical protein CME88_03030 [Hirschia sp.]|nr:hypothetical protein [Hirschia sp.]MBF17334.1 hypothetical protein [Hirschia sp.]|tara:strand:+ start:1625 stop:2017 length:393 start_codon:yes stop_codon:yes gene_type:complete
MKMTRILSFLAIFAISLRALLPTGYMLSVDDAAGMVRVEICGGGVQHDAVWLDPISGKLLSEQDLPDNPPQDDAPCAFASLTVVNLPDPGIEILPAYGTIFLGSKPIKRDVINTAPRRILPPLRGPPLHV